MSGEQFLIRTIGGPYPGTRVVPGPWPLKDEIHTDGGLYRKVSQSELTDEQMKSTTHVLRGAEYEWVPS